jgi:hypothetical protein
VKRIYHTWEKWECYPAGFYEDKAPNGMTPQEATSRYAAFLRDTPAFEAALARVISEWKFSCEHYLSNVNMNRIAWLGQASACIALGLPSAFRSGFHLLTPKDQETANETALAALNFWLERQGEEPIASVGEAESRTEMNLY